MTTIQFISIASFGAAVQEIIHLYDIRNKLHVDNFSVILSSWKYWLITVAMIITSGVGTWILYGENLNIRSVIFILGAAFPLLFKKLVAGATSKNEPGLGEFSTIGYFK